MDKIKHSWRNLSLKKSLVIYVAVFTILAIILSVITVSLCDKITDIIRMSYPTVGKKYYLTTEQGERLGEGTYINDVPTPITEQDERKIALLELIPIIATPLYSALCIITATLLFYKNKLKEPISKLMIASQKISDNNLDFSIKSDSNDELGQLCTSFEIMRNTLAHNFFKMWRQAEERKQLNAAFAHDLRTPLTVLKGYNEILQSNNDTQIKETANTMEKHILRMEKYINSMSNLRRLEDMQPEYKLVSLETFIYSLYESAKIVCNQKGKTLYLENKISIPQLLIDIDFVSQVSNNLISNAVCYAKTSITMCFSSSDNGLLLIVSDDGKGFNENSLNKAVKPYFTEETNHSEHFGLGLYICKLLCEHHEGYLKIGNTSNGAKIIAFFKSVVDKK